MSHSEELIIKLEELEDQVDSASVELIAYLQRRFTPSVATAATLRVATMLASMDARITEERFLEAARLRFRDSSSVMAATRECRDGGQPCPLHADMPASSRRH